MPDPSRLCAVLLAGFLAGCATAPETVVAPSPAPVPAPAPPPEPPPPVAAKPSVDVQARLEEARAMLAQAETDIQRARAKRALWLRAWESLLAAREAVAREDVETALRAARAASEFAQLGLEQLAYPAVK